MTTILELQQKMILSNHLTTSAKQKKEESFLRAGTGICQSSFEDIIFHLHHIRPTRLCITVLCICTCVCVGVYPFHVWDTVFVNCGSFPIASLMALAVIIYSLSRNYLEQKAIIIITSS